MPKMGSRTVIAALTALALLGACSKSETLLGEAGDPGEVSRVIEISTTDELRFDPSEIDVEAGETIEFSITNEASSPHEFVMGPAHEHTDDMQHTEANASGAIEPGDTASVVWYFPDAGEVSFACHIANHDQSGMTGTITISE